MYKNGTIKLTWINPKDYSILESTMYNTLEEAVANSKDKNNFLIFELISSEGEKYSWKLLPYGKYKAFLMELKYRDSMLVKGALVGVGLLAIYGFYKLIAR